MFVNITMPSMQWFPSYNIAWPSKTNQTANSSFFSRKRIKTSAYCFVKNNKTVVENTTNNSQTKALKNKNSNNRCVPSFNGQNQTIPRRRNLNGSSINQSPDTLKNCYEQIQLIPVSILKGKKAFDTYALIDPGSQCSFVLDAISEYLEVPCESQQSVALQFLNTENKMTLSKINEPVTITPYKSIPLNSLEHTTHHHWMSVPQMFSNWIKFAMHLTTYAIFTSL